MSAAREGPSYNGHVVEQTCFVSQYCSAINIQPEEQLDGLPAILYGLQLSEKVGNHQ